jgi:NADH-quinone oxidoreductase subunit C
MSDQDESQAPATPPAEPPKPAAAEGKPAAPTPPAKAAAAAAKPAAKAEPKTPPPPGPPDPPPPADLPVPAYVAGVQTALPGAVTQVSYFVGDWVLIVPRERLVDVLTWLRDAPEAAFDYCSDATAVDWPTRAERFDVLLNLYSVRHRHRVRVKTRVKDGEDVPTTTGVWPATNWFEREIYDMFGIRFAGHPDLRRILMPDDWQGHPQRKDYPLEGPGELLLEDPLDWLKLRASAREAEIE